MDKEKKILTYTISYLLIGLFICLIGISNVFAEEISPTTGYRTQLGSFNQYSGEVIWKTSNIGQYNTPLYFTEGQDYYNFFIPGYIRLAVITDVDTNYSYKISYNMIIYDLKTSDWDISKINTNYDLRVNDDSSIIKDYKCSVVSSDFIEGTNGNTIENKISCVFNVNYNVDDAWLNTGYICKNCTLSGVENFGTVTSNAYMYVTNPKLERFEDNSGIIIDQNQTIIDQNNKTNEELENIKDNINNMEDSIIENNNQNTQDIIDSNKETQEVIKDQFNDCRDSYNLLDFKSALSYWGITDYTYSDGLYTLPTTINQAYSKPFTLDLKSNTTYTLSNEAVTQGSTGLRIQLIEDGNIIGYINLGTSTNSYTFTTKSGSIYSIRINFTTGGYPIYIKNLMLNEGTKKNYEEPGKICTNKIDETNDKLDNLQGSITDSSSPNTGALENSAGWLPAGPLDSILNLPLTMLNSLTNSLGKSCSPLNLTLPYVNKNIQIPCLSSIFSQITGVDGLWTWVGTIASVLILYNYLLNLYAWVDRVLTLRAEFDEAMGADLANWGRL